MELSRRSLFGAAAAAGVAATVAACEAGAGREGRPSPLRADSWESVREQFVLAPGVAHLATFVFASHPAAVRSAVEAHRRGFDADPVGYLHRHELPRHQALRAAASRHLGVKADQIAFTDSTTMGLGLLYTGLRLRPGDEVLTTEHDFYATHESLRLRSARDGAQVRRVRLYRDAATAGEDEIVNSLLGAVTARTRVVAVTWVHSSTGVKLPITAMAEALRRRNPEVLLCVDGVHGFGAEDATFDELGADFLVTGCHKWLFGPRGTGLVCGSARGWARYTPVIPSFDTRQEAGPLATPGGYHSFEHRWALTEAFDFHAAVGAERIAVRTRELATALKDGLAGVKGVRLVTPADPRLSAGIVCCDVDGVDPQDAVNLLAQAKVVASATPYRPSYLRFGPTILNTERDVDAALAAVRALT